MVRSIPAVPRTFSLAAFSLTGLVASPASATLIEIGFFKTTVADYQSDFESLASEFRAAGGTQDDLDLIDTISLPELSAGAVVGSFITVGRIDNNRNRLAFDAFFLEIDGLLGEYDFDSPTDRPADLEDPFAYGDPVTIGLTRGPDGIIWTADDENLGEADASVEYDGLIFGGISVEASTFADLDIAAEPLVDEQLTFRAEARGGFGGVVVFGDGERTLTVTAVPEPGAAAGLAIGGAVLLRRRRAGS